MDIRCDVDAIGLPLFLATAYRLTISYGNRLATAYAIRFWCGNSFRNVIYDSG